MRALSMCSVFVWAVIIPRTSPLPTTPLYLPKYACLSCKSGNIQKESASSVIPPHTHFPLPPYTHTHTDVSRPTDDTGASSPRMMRSTKGKRRLATRMLLLSGIAFRMCCSFICCICNLIYMYMHTGQDENRHAMLMWQRVREKLEAGGEVDEQVRAEMCGVFNLVKRDECKGFVKVFVWPL